MATKMMICPTCKKTISSEAQSCPKCGNVITDEARSKEIKRIRQRTLIAWIIILLLVWFFWPKKATTQGAEDSKPSKEVSEQHPTMSSKDKQYYEQSLGIDSKNIVQDIFRQYIALDNIAATEMKDAGKAAGELGKGTTVNQLRKELEDVQAAAPACYGSIKDITIPDNLPDTIKKHVIDGRDNFLMASQLREKMANVFIQWLDTGDKSLPKKVQDTSNMVSMALLSGMSSYTAAMSLAGFSDEEIQAELSAAKDKPIANTSTTASVKFQPFRRMVKQHIKIVVDVSIDLVDGRLPNKAELLSVAHTVLDGASTPGQWVNFYLPGMDHNNAWFACVEIKDGVERVRFNPYSIPDNLKHLYKE